MINANISRFKGDYNELNNKNILNISRLQLTRSVITVGHKDISGVKEAGLYRFAHLLFMTLAHTCVDSEGFLGLSKVFWNLDASERRVVAYHLGQGFAKATAELLLDIPWLEHLSQLGDKVVLDGESSNKLRKYYYASCKQNAREPDLIGFDNMKFSHIFEAKGYSSGFYKSTLQHAIDQVSHVTLVNNKEPKTKVACYYDMSKTPIQATIIDPVDNNEDGIKINMEFPDFIKAYYSIFSEGKTWENPILLEFNNRIYRTKALVSPYYYGVDENIILHLERDVLPEEDFVIYSEFSLDQGDEHLVSIGLDGIILIKQGNVKEISGKDKCIRKRIDNISSKPEINNEDFKFLLKASHSPSLYTRLNAVENLSRTNFDKVVVTEEVMNTFIELSNDNYSLIAKFAGQILKIINKKLQLGKLT